MAIHLNRLIKAGVHKVGVARARGYGRKMISRNMLSINVKKYEFFLFLVKNKTRQIKSIRFRNFLPLDHEP